jgi:hypothetical protein
MMQKILYYRIIHLRVWEQEESKNNEHYYIENFIHIKA